MKRTSYPDRELRPGFGDRTRPCDCRNDQQIHQHIHAELDAIIGEDVESGAGPERSPIHGNRGSLRAVAWCRGFRIDPGPSN